MLGRITPTNKFANENGRNEKKNIWVFEEIVDPHWFLVHDFSKTSNELTPLQQEGLEPENHPIEKRNNEYP